MALDQPLLQPDSASLLDLPVLPLVNTVLFPAMLAPLFVNRERSLAAVDEAMAADRMIVAIAQRTPETDDYDLNELYQYGVEAVILRVLKLPDGTTSVLLQGQRRVQVREWHITDDCLHALVEPLVLDEERKP